MDSSRSWCRCSRCKAYGFSKAKFSVRAALPRGGRKVKVVPYKCSVDRCSEIAVRRKPGRGPRCSYIWRCGEHDDD